jgi:Dolichyl-phosphate-mannose-protein mannosyltransferase
MATIVAYAEPAVRDRTDRRLYPSLVVLLAIGVLLRVLFLDRQGLWFDEGVGLIFSTCDSLGQCLDRMLDTRTAERFQFVYPLMLHEWRGLFGSSEIALRSLSVLCGVMAMPLIWSTARRSFGNAHANWTLAFTACSALTLVHAQEARPYTFFLLIAAAQIALLLAARRGGGPWVRVGFYLTTAIASWAGLFPLLFSVALALADLASRPRRWTDAGQWLMWWLPAGLLCLPATAYYLIAAAEADPSRITVPKSGNPLLNLIFVGYGQLVGQTFGPPVEELREGSRAVALLESWHLLLALAVVLGTGVAQGVRLVRHHQLAADMDVTRFLLWAVAAYVALSFIFAVLTRHNWLPRHAIALHPLVALLLPLLTRPVVAGGPALAGRAIMSAILLLNLFAVGQHYFNRGHWKDDYRSTAAYLKANGEPLRPVIVLRGLPVLLEYYGYGQLTYAPDPPPARVGALVREAAADRAEIAVVVNRESDLWPPGWLDDALAPDFRPIARTNFPYFAVYTYAKR